MELFLFIFGLVTGGVISLCITHIYYRKSTHDQNTLFNKLSEELRNLILHDHRDRLSVMDLNELIQKKTIDTEIGEAIPYIACPRCGSEDLKRSSDVEVDYDLEGPILAGHYDIVQCRNCGWTKTSHGYESSRDDI